MKIYTQQSLTRLLRYLTPVLFFFPGLINMLFSQTTSCPNSNFSENSFNNWSGCSGLWCAETGFNTRCSGLYIPYNLPCNNINQPWYNSPIGGHFLITSPGTDPYIPEISTVFPGDQYSALLGYRQIPNGGGYVDQLSHQLTYEPDNSFFIYRFAAVLCNITDPDHDTPDKRPRFTVEIRDHLTQTVIDPTCGFFDVYPGDNQPGWNSANVGGQEIQWKNWNSIGLDLSKLSGIYTGQVLDVVFTTHGCAFTAHTAYAYISVVCSQMTVVLSGCSGASTVTLTGPPGFAEYEWYGPICGTCSPTIVCSGPDPNCTIINANEGDIYRLNMVSFNGCEVNNTFTTIAFTIVIPSFSSNVNCVGNQSTFTDLSTSTNPNQPIVSRKWQFETGGPWEGPYTSPTITHIYSTDGPHEVSVESYSQDGCVGTTSQTITVDLAPTITNPSLNKSFCSGENVGLTMDFSQTGAYGTWSSVVTTGSATITPIPPEQSGNLINDQIVNTGIVNAIVTYTITPKIDNCVGIPVQGVITVYPTPHLTNAAPSPICSGMTFNVTLVPDVTGGDFTWTATCNPGGSVTGFTATQPTNVILINDVLTNITTAPATVTYHITPHANGCDGPPSDFTVTVNPTPHLTNAAPAPICSGTTFNVTLVPDVTGGDFTWTATCNPVGSVTGFTATQATNVILISDILTNVTTAPATVTYHITPHANGCDGPPSDFTVTVNPTPHLTNAAPAPICSGTTFNVTLVPDVTGGDFTWTASCNPGGSVTGFTVTQATNVILINDILTNVTTAPATVTYHITPHANGCDGPPSDFTVTVNPTPHFTNAAPAPICSGTTFNVTLVPDVTGGDFTWTATCNPVGSVTGFTATQPTNVTLINDVLTNITTAPLPSLTTSLLMLVGATVHLPTLPLRLIPLRILPMLHLRLFVRVRPSM